MDRKWNVFRKFSSKALDVATSDDDKIYIKIAIAIADITEKLSEKAETIDSMSYTQKLAFLENLEIIKRSI